MGEVDTLNLKNLGILVAHNERHRDDTTFLPMLNATLSNNIARTGSNHYVCDIDSRNKLEQALDRMLFALRWMSIGKPQPKAPDDGPPSMEV